MKCRHCDSDEVVKDGKNPSGSEKYYCKRCERNFTPQPSRHGYSQETRREAVRMYVDGANYRRIGRFLKVSHQSVVNWVNQAASVVNPQAAPRPQVGQEDVVELDELFTFVSDKKTKRMWSPKSTAKRAVS